MRVALVHDYLCGIGGSERVFQYICQEFPEADIYTLAYNPKQTFPYFKSRKINKTWLNTFVQSPGLFRLSFPIATHVMEHLNLNGYDLVLSSSATVAKYVNVKEGKHICYCYIPTRAIWKFEDYFQKSLVSSFFKILLPHLKKRDFKAAQKVDHFIAISEDTRGYIKNFYQRDSNVIYCPIETDKFYPALKREDYYLVVSRLEHWKRVDYAIDAFNELGLHLKVIGTGAEEQSLKLRAKGNIEFLGEVDDQRLAQEYSKCKAVIFTPYLEYGLIPLEANASGAPVIAYGKGGITETMIHGDNRQEKKPTAVFFYEQSSHALIEAIKKFQEMYFDSSYLVDHAFQWSVPAFQKKIRHFLENYLKG